MDAYTADITSYTIDVPTLDIKRFRAIVKAMGWSVRKKNAVERSLDEIKQGKVFTYSNLDELKKEFAS